MRRLLRPVCILLLLIAIWPLAGQAQSDLDYNNCSSSRDADLRISACTRLIVSGDLTQANLAISFNNRGIAWRDKRDYDRAIADYNEALRLNPQYALAYHNRSIAWHNKRDYDRAIADYNEALRLNPQDAAAYNSLAWLHATALAPSVRNGARAVELARKAAELSAWKAAYIIDTLAAAYAEAGNFAEAVRWQEKALELTGNQDVEGYKKRLALYRQGLPYREEP